jgi:soluble lytic murein transglycosylase-like protein
MTAFFGMIVRSEELAAVILANADAFHISPALAFALCWEESRYHIRAVNRRNSNKTVDRGLFQLNSSSFPDLREEDFFNPGANSYYGLAHLRWCLDTGGSEVAGLAMYNAGTGRVRAGTTPKITLDYVSRILENRRKIEELFLTWNALNGSLEPLPAPPPPPEPPPLTLLSPSGRP